MQLLHEDHCSSLWCCFPSFNYSCSSRFGCLNFFMKLFSQGVVRYFDPSRYPSDKFQYLIANSS